MLSAGPHIRNEMWWSTFVSFDDHKSPIRLPNATIITVGPAIFLSFGLLSVFVFNPHYNRVVPSGQDDVFILQAANPCIHVCIEIMANLKIIMKYTILVRALACSIQIGTFLILKHHILTHNDH